MDVNRPHLELKIMKTMLVAGARPNFMKVASVTDAINTHNRYSDAPIDYLLVHTGQHYDEQMSQASFRDLGLLFRESTWKWGRHRTPSRQRKS